MNELDEVLQYLEEHMDAGHIACVKQKHKDTLDYKNEDGFPVKVKFDSEAFKPFPYIQAYHDMETMLYNELVAAKFTLSICDAVKVLDDTLPMIRANYGVSTLPSVFGLDCKIINNNLPWVEHAGNAEEVKKVISRGIPDIKSGLGGRTLETYEFYRERLSKYPKCSKLITLYHPDIQGPFDLAHLIWGTDLYYAVYDYPGLVHELLDLVTDTYILYLNELRKLIDDREDIYLYHWGSLFKGGMLIRNDTATNLSPGMYNEFVKPYDERILRSFNGGSIHFCGRGDQWIYSMLECEGLGALNNGQPVNLTFGTEYLEKIYDRASERNIALVDYIVSRESIDEIRNSRFQKGVIYKINTADSLEAIELLDSLK